TFGAPSGGRKGSIGRYVARGSRASYIVGPTYGRSGMGSTSRGTSVAMLRLLLHRLPGRSGPSSGGRWRTGSLPHRARLRSTSTAFTPHPARDACRLRERTHASRTVHRTHAAVHSDVP